MARFINDQEIEYLGRIDNQVKIRGFRIELGDIKSKLSQTEGVSHAFVTTEKTGDETVLLAYLLVNKALSYEEVIDSISSELPDYMIPQHFYIVSEIPLTVNNKVDMKRLHQSATKLLPSVRNTTAESETEIAVQTVWKQILDLEEIDLESDFFSLGGNSGSILKVFNALDKQYKQLLSVADLFRYRNIQTLARFISEKFQKNNPGPKPAHKQKLRFSFPQEQREQSTNLPPEDNELSD